MRNRQRIVSAVLAVSILLQYFSPTIILAYDLINYNATLTKEEIKEPVGKVVEELVEKRQPNIKYFIKDDFTYEAMIYPSNVHYLKDGTYVDINNKLETKQNISDFFAESYENKDNAFKVKFFKKLNNNYIYRLKDGKYEINYDLVGINRAINAIKQEQIVDEDVTTLDNIFDGVTYKNVYDNIDLSYLIMPDGVKENIILNSKTDKTEFTYEINVKNLTLSIKDNVIYFTKEDTNEVYFDNITLYKDESGNSFTYDANGNLVNSKDNAKSNTLTNYDNKSQLISTLLPSGSKLNYEYDYNYKNRLLSATSKDGLSFNFTYDNYGNATSTKVSETSLASTIDVNQTYYIKAIPSNLYVGVNGSVNTNGSNIELMALGTTGNQEWKFIDLGGGYYNIKPANTITNTMMEAASSGTIDGTNIHILASNGGNNQKFKLIINDDSSYTFKPKHLETSCLDISSANFNPGANIQEWNCNNTIAQKFYIIKKDTSNNKYIETNQEYSANGDYLTKQKDALGNEVIYNYNIDGTLNNTVDSKNKVTNYTYDTLGRVVSVSKSGYSNSYSYTNDNLSSISHNGFNYNFIYDTFGNTKQVRVNNTNLITNNYASNNGNLLNSVYGNNQTVSYAYDRFNRVIKKTTGNNIYEYMYDNRGNLAVTKDNTNTYNYSYDLADRLLKASSNNYNISYKYGNNNNLSNVYYKYLTNTNTVSYTYDTLARISSVNNGNNSISYNYDLLSRLNNKVLTVGNNTYQTNYSYITNNNKTSIIVGSISNGSNQLSYTYDLNGNIETILDNNIEVSRYYYDDLNQLIKEDNAYLNHTITYTYDLGGNISSKTIYEYQTTNLIDTINYTYDINWKDQLISYDNKQITYDSIGNPISYDTYTYEWINGRQLSKIIDNSNTYQYKYNDSGIREEKLINGVSTKYYLEGSKVIYQTNGPNTIYYMYDETGNIIGLKYNSLEYYYIKNAQNDIIGLLDSNLNKIVNYQYDSWGNIISITDNNGIDISNNPNHIGNINPYRYRSYYYDTESNLYYLQSRYYSPTWGRFLNADGISAVGELSNQDNKNLYTYTNNNPINRLDENGRAWWGLAGAVFGGFTGATSRAVSNLISGKPLLAGTVGAFAGGAITGFLLTTTFNPALAYYAGAGVESILNETSNYVNGSKKGSATDITSSLKKVTEDTIYNGTISLITGNMAGNTVKTNSGWFKPTKLTSSFTGNYAKKIVVQNLVQSAYQFSIENSINPMNINSKSNNSKNILSGLK